MAIKQYRKKPVVIEAVHYEGINIEEIRNFLGEYIVSECMDPAISDVWPASFDIRTLEGNMTASFGDYIIKGVKGEFYPCKPDIFEQTYDLYEPAKQITTTFLKKRRK